MKTFYRFLHHGFSNLAVSLVQRDMARQAGFRTFYVCVLSSGEVVSVADTAGNVR